MPDDGAGVNGEDLVESNCNFSLGSSNKLKNTQKVVQCTVVQNLYK